MDINTVIRAVKARLEEQWPGETVYEDLLPNGFTRPSFLVEFVSLTERDVNAALIRRETSIRITCYTETDAYYDSVRAELNERLNRCIGLFSRGSFAAGDRYLHVGSAAGTTEADYAQATILLYWVDGRPDNRAAEEPPPPEGGGIPKMEHYQLQILTGKD